MLLSYGQVEIPRQGEIIRPMGSPRLATQPAIIELAKALVQGMRESERTSFLVGNEGA